MIKVAFWFDRPQAYAGGLNYLRNLLYALSVIPDKRIQPFIFFGKSVDAKLVAGFEPHATVVRTSVLDRLSPLWFLHKVLFKFFGSTFVIERILRAHGIAIISHAEHVHARHRAFHIISWIPDFQYLHLPELFPGLDTAAETRRMRTMAAQTDALIFSSYSALQDYRSIADPECTTPVTVLQFVSQPSRGKTAAARGDLERRYGFSGSYFFLPNQFWVHKNHAVAFEAVRLLKQRGVEVQVICTGNLMDYRNRDASHAESLRKFLANHGLGNNVKILGVIDYADVLGLMENALAVINPSRFEGWSSSVEEAKSLGKPLILSDIPVHREQAPPGGTYFPPDDATALAVAIEASLNRPDDAAGATARRCDSAASLESRTLAYGHGYTQLVVDLTRRLGSHPKPRTGRVTAP